MMAIIRMIDDWCHVAHRYARRQGFWGEVQKGEAFDYVNIVLAKLALITKEVGGAVNAVRDEDKEKFGEELADACIRLFDLAEACGVNLEQEIVWKMERNEDRPHMHGRRA